MTLVTPTGYRMEGLDLASAGKLLEEYGIERTLSRVPEDAGSPEGERALAERLRIRRKRSRLVVAEIFRLTQEKKGGIPERSTMGKALAYLLRLRQGLEVFLRDPRVPLDNNHAEHALRGVVVGRKNHYGSRSRLGTKVAALFYTFLETARLSGVDPAAYLRTALDAPPWSAPWSTRARSPCRTISPDFSSPEPEPRALNPGLVLPPE